MKLTRIGRTNWSPLPMFLLFAAMIAAVLVASPEHRNLGPGIALLALMICGILEGIINRNTDTFSFYRRPIRK